MGVAFIYFLLWLQAAKSVFRHSGAPPPLRFLSCVPSQQLPQRLQLQPNQRLSVVAMAGNGDANTRATDFGQRGDGPSKEQQQACSCSIPPATAPSLALACFCIVWRLPPQLCCGRLLVMNAYLSPHSSLGSRLHRA